MPTARRLPDALEIRPRGPLDAEVRVPGSKSISNRALLIAGLAAGNSQLDDVLTSDDTEALCGALTTLGVRIQQASSSWKVRGTDGALRAPDAPLDVRASGTAARFLTAAAALAPGAVVIDGSARLRERPIDDLVRALTSLGVDAEILGKAGCPPVRVAGGGLEGGDAVVDARRSSQFVSALLLVAPYARKDLRLRLQGDALVSRPYVDLTIQVMRAFGAEVEWTAPGDPVAVKAGARYAGRRYRIEADASTAAYFFCAAAIAGGRVRVPGLPAASAQADIALLEVLEEMGCAVERGPDAISVRGPAGPLRGVDVDMNAMPDAVLALAVTALFASGPTTIRNVAHLRIKESDRLAALEAELRKLGAGARAGPDSLTIEPARLHGARIATHDDHRMAMAFALAGLRVPGVWVLEPACVAKSWPNYFEALEGL